MELNKIQLENPKFYKRIIISRCVQENEKNKYFLDDVKVSPTKNSKFFLYYKFKH